MFTLLFFPRVILYNFLLFWLIMVVWGHGVGVLYWDFEWGFSVYEFGASGVGPSGFLGWGSLYKHKRITPEKKWCVYVICMCPILTHVTIVVPFSLKHRVIRYPCMRRQNLQLLNMDALCYINRILWLFCGTIHYFCFSKQ